MARRLVPPGWTVAAANAAIGRVGQLIAAVHGTSTPGVDPRLVATAAAWSVAEEGIVLRDISRGLVDFTARTDDGRLYWLCWLVGEEEVGWWHWPQDGFAGRRPLSDPPS